MNTFGIMRLSGDLYVDLQQDFWAISPPILGKPMEKPQSLDDLPFSSFFYYS